MILPTPPSPHSSVSRERNGGVRVRRLSPHGLPNHGDHEEPPLRLYVRIRFLGTEMESPHQRSLEGELGGREEERERRACRINSHAPRPLRGPPRFLWYDALGLGTQA